jgi:hypothetical protein
MIVWFSWLVYKYDELNAVLWALQEIVWFHMIAYLVCLWFCDMNELTVWWYDFRPLIGLFGLLYVDLLYEWIGWLDCMIVGLNCLLYLIINLWKLDWLSCLLFWHDGWFDDCKYL